MSLVVDALVYKALNTGKELPQANIRSLVGEPSIRPGPLQAKNDAPVVDNCESDSTTPVDLHGLHWFLLGFLLPW